MTLSESLAVLLDDGIIQDVLGRIMSGKEAEVYAVLRDNEACAAKIYKPRTQRSFKNNAAYTEGRAMTRDSRARRAIAKGTTFGKTVEEKSWKDTEHDALQLAWNAGVRVPQPIFLYEDALLMQLIVDGEGMPAPRMSDLSFNPEDAIALHAEMIENIKKLLIVHRVHGDLSAYNVLMAVDGPVIIDMPQVIDCAQNLRANEFLERDVRNITEYLARFAPSLMHYAGAGAGLWRHYKAGTLQDAQLADLAEAPTRQVRRDPPRQQGQQNDGRQVRADGRVEVVMGGGNQGRRTRGFSRDGRAADGGRRDGANPRREERDGPKAPRPENRPPQQPGPRPPRQENRPQQQQQQQRPPRQDNRPAQPQQPRPPRQDNGQQQPQQPRPPRQDNGSRPPRNERPQRAQGPNPAHHGEHRGHGRHR